MRWGTFIIMDGNDPPHWKDVSFPFAVMRDDLVRLSDQNLSVEGYYSKTFLLLPEGFESVYDLDTLNATFGDSKPDRDQNF